MANKKFTEQEMLTLRNSKYVLDVSPSIVHFSAEFKKLFWEELSKGRPTLSVQKLMVSTSSAATVAHSLTRLCAS